MGGEEAARAQRAPSAVTTVVRLANNKFADASGLTFFLMIQILFFLKKSGHTNNPRQVYRRGSRIGGVFKDVRRDMHTSASL